MTRLSVYEFSKVAELFERLGEALKGEDSMEIEDNSITISGTYKGFEVVIGTDFNTVNSCIEYPFDTALYEEYEVKLTEELKATQILRFLDDYVRFALANY